MCWNAERYASPTIPMLWNASCRVNIKLECHIHAIEQYLKLIITLRCIVIREYLLLFVIFTALVRNGRITKNNLFGNNCFSFSLFIHFARLLYDVFLAMKGLSLERVINTVVRAYIDPLREMQGIYSIRVIKL